VLRILLIVVALGVAAGIAVGLAHTDNPAMQAPPLEPVIPQYGDRDYGAGGG
jgi:hypothetical protein